MEDQTFIEVLRSILQEQKEYPEGYVPTEKELYDDLAAQYAQIDKYDSAESFSDSGIGADAVAFRIAMKAALQIKQAQMSGLDMDAADLAATVALNDLKKVLGDKYSK